MQTRLAKKIVLRVQSGLVSHLTYPRPQVEDAFRVLGLTPTAEHLQPWTDQESRVQEDPEAVAARQEANRIRKEQATATLEARRRERAERRVAGAARAAYLTSIRTGVLADHVQGVSAADVAVAAGRAAFERTIQAGRVPSHIEITPSPAATLEEVLGNDKIGISMGAQVEEAPEPGQGYANMTVEELKDLAKSQGFKGLSTKKRADLIALLTRT